MPELYFGEVAQKPLENIDAEEGMLGAILLDPTQAIALVLDLPPEAFYISQHRIIFEAAIALHVKELPTDLIHMSTYLGDNSLLERAGGLNKLVQLADRSVGSGVIKAWASLVKERWLRRKLVEAGNDLVRLAYDTSRDVEELIEDACDRVFQIRQKNDDDENDKTETLAEIAPRVFKEIEARNSDDPTSSFLETGFYDIDNLIHGLPIGYPSVIAARSGMGKTTFAIELALRFAMQGLPVAFFSLEMSKSSMVEKILARMSAPNIMAGDLYKTKGMQGKDWLPLIESVHSTPQVPIIINAKSKMTPSQIRAELQLITRKHGQLGLVVIDYIGLMDSDGGGGKRIDTRVIELDKIMRDLRSIAKDFNVPLLGLSQINRGVEARSDKRPLMSDIRDSGGIEQEAAVILTVYQDEYYNPDTPDKGISEIGIVKNRFGGTGIARLLFQPQYGRFLNAQK